MGRSTGKDETVAYAKRRRAEGATLDEVAAELRQLGEPAPGVMVRGGAQFSAGWVHHHCEKPGTYDDRANIIELAKKVTPPPGAPNLTCRKNKKSGYQKAKRYARARRAEGIGFDVIAAEITALGFRSLNDDVPTAWSVSAMCRGVPLPGGRKRLARQCRPISKEIHVKSAKSEAISETQTTGATPMAVATSTPLSPVNWKKPITHADGHEVAYDGEMDNGTPFKHVVLVNGKKKVFNEFGQRMQSSGELSKPYVQNLPDPKPVPLPAKPQPAVLVEPEAGIDDALLDLIESFKTDMTSTRKLLFTAVEALGKCALELQSTTKALRETAAGQQNAYLTAHQMLVDDLKNLIGHDPKTTEPLPAAAPLQEKPEVKVEQPKPKPVLVHSLAEIGTAIKAAKIKDLEFVESDLLRDRLRKLALVDGVTDIVVTRVTERFTNRSRRGELQFVGQAPSGGVGYRVKGFDKFTVRVIVVYCKFEIKDRLPTLINEIGCCSAASRTAR